MKNYNPKNCPACGGRADSISWESGHGTIRLCRDCGWRGIPYLGAESGKREMSGCVVAV